MIRRLLLAAPSSMSELEERLVGWRDLDARRFDAPDLTGVLGNGPVAGELS